MINQFIRDFRQNGDFNIHITHPNGKTETQFIRDFRQNGDFNQIRRNSNTNKTAKFIRDFQRNGDFNIDPLLGLIGAIGLSGTFDRTGTST